MSISVNGQSCVPPGFRFHPTEEELLNYYLRKKVANEKIDLDVIRDVDLNKLEPWDIQEKCKIGSTPQNDWYFFSHKDKKYPTGTRTNRATAAGFWKATGRDKVIYNSFKRIGMRKTLVFYKGRAPHGQKSDWIMHEYRLDENADSNSHSHSHVTSPIGEANQEDGWVVCRVFKKKNHLKAISSPKNCSSITSDAKTQLMHSSSDDALDQILQYMGRSCKQETEKYPSTSSTLSFKYLKPIETIASMHERFMKLPALESPTFQSSVSPTCESQDSYMQETVQAVVSMDQSYNSGDGITDWVAMDRLVASHLNGQADPAKHELGCFDEPGFNFYSTSKLLLNSGADECTQGTSVITNGINTSAAGGCDGDLWSFTKSASSGSGSERLSNVSL
ncbi:hypothetical protein LUZ62_061414 [Rhynchospora pubera]|uniref:NAC domain-containing protein n=1 Tax=Rhynchospora pubera TaxID=906938 RepID=A0AAV8E7Q8_9POAL|nr:hypothetical protein LUZ62_061414 [Rhynchospora pubera]